MKYTENENQETMNMAGAPNRPVADDTVRGGGPQNPRTVEEKKAQDKGKKSPGYEKPSTPGDRGQKELA